VCYYPADRPGADLYDALTHEYLVRNAGEEACFDIPARSSRLVMVLPSGSKIKMRDGKYITNEKIVAYHQLNIR
jgi:hypothetical protein